MRTLGIFILLWFGIRQTSAHAQLDSIRATATLSEHPRILLSQGEVQALQQAIQSDTSLGLVHQLLLAQCDSILLSKRSALSPTRVGRIQHSDVREALRRLFALSYGWRLTGRQAYFDRAKHELWMVLIVYWHREQVEHLAEITTAASLAYDWLYSNLSPRDRDFVQKTIIKKGLEAAFIPRDSSWTVPTDYQKQVVNTGLVFGALAIYETQPELARSILNRSIRSTRQLLTHYEPDGAYPYGYSAWSYATSFTALLISALQNEFKTDFGLLAQTGFLKTAAYGLHMRAPSGNCFNYGKADLEAPLQPVQFWLAHRAENQWAGWKERNWLVSKKANAWQKEALLPALLIWSYRQPLTGNSQPPGQVWVGRGKAPIALLRSSWHDSTALFMGLKAGTPSLADAHMDVGSFVVESQGVRWAIDLGPQNMDSLQLAGVDMQQTNQNAPRWLVYRNSTMGHNTLVANYGAQLVNGFAPISSHSNQPAFLNAITDLTSLYADDLVSARRGVAIRNGRSMLVQDEVETGSKETVMRWAFVTGAEVERIDSHRAILSQSGKKLLVALDPGSGLTLRTWSTGPRYEHDSVNPGTMQVGFETTIPPGTKRSWKVEFIPEIVSLEAVSPMVPLAQWPHE
ncbi:heparinase II/III domain-containing protein [Larkinella rosea]|uniref:Heparinase n=1 Tax=Larkinella rosea TaxID=2025312 RepID=A0A3P1BJV1_9BACT|nr:heparinase II/III family protein [Larkinella rosea]RRB01133.1 heparinase [Larkinella rosea]